ncbi:hypothetical protein FQR65_LT02345 [Abscondita terminalis]|nr:hypothetical protein FQR65_LT02345 [Abscondita terminalis]
MKLLIICAAIYLAKANQNLLIRDDIIQHWDQLLNIYKNECINESGVKSEMVINVVELLKLPNDRNYKCFLKCLYERLGLLSNDGIFNLQSMAKKVKAADVDLVEQTMNLLPEIGDNCEKAYQFALKSAIKVALRYPKLNLNLNLKI